MRRLTMLLPLLVVILGLVGSGCAPCGSSGACAVTTDPVLKTSPPVPPAPGDGPFNMTVLHFNDVHAAFTPEPAAWRDDHALVGGVVALQSHLEEERAVAAASITLDAGDFMTGHPICEIPVDGVQGGGFVDMLNRLSIDAGVIGNHEFDLGRANARALAARCNHPRMALDLVDEHGDLEYPAEPVVLHRGDLDVGVIGVTCAGLMDVCADSRVAGLHLLDQETVTRRWVERLDPQTDLLVLLTHNGVQGDTTLARKLAGSGVDVIVGGHSHTRLKEPLLIGDVLVVQAGSRMTNLGRLDLRVENDRVTEYAGRLIETTAAGRGADPELQALVTHYDDLVDAEFGQVIGTLTEPWRRHGGRESNVGDWICDRLRDAAGADVALLNSGTLRKNVDAGPLTRLDVFQLLPFANLLETFEIDGRGLERICLINARNGEADQHGILQVGGLRYAYRADGEDVELLEVTVNGQPLDPDHVYTVACPDYVAMKADLYMDMTKPVTRSTGVTVTDAIIAAVEASGPIAASTDGRIARR